ncbi:MAG: septation protein SepH [bacterium]|nr:septation protein SepH [bacterium]
MSELNLAGVKDGTHLVLRDAEGSEFTLPIDDALRHAIRRERAEQPAGSSGPLSPREIQAMLRAGSSVDEVAELAGLTAERVEKYEGPVAAERAWVIQQAMNIPVGRHPDSPILGDLAVDRLAIRKVDPASLEWDAVRSGSGPWTVLLDFPVEEKVQRASWEVDLQTRAIHAIDDEARWLSEPDSPSGRAGRGLASVISAFPARGEQLRDAGRGMEADAGSPESGPNGPEASCAASPEPSTDALLDSLTESRGVRQIPAGFDEDPDLLDALAEEGIELPREREDGAEAHVVSLDSRRTPASPVSAESPEDPADGAAEAGGAGTQAPSSENEEAGSEKGQEQAAPAPRSRRTRRSVPSWDEIVFGSKGD